MNKLRRSLALLLVLLMQLSALPTTALAEESDENDPSQGQTMGIPKLKSLKKAGPSLIPLPEINATLDLKDYLPEEMSAIPASVVLEKLTAKDEHGQDIKPFKSYNAADGEMLVWSTSSDKNEYTVTEPKEGTLDLTGVSQISLQVGVPDQLDAASSRYVVTIESFGNFNDSIVLSAAYDSSTAVTLSGNNYANSGYTYSTAGKSGEIGRLNKYIALKDWQASKFYVSLNKNNMPSSIDAKVYEGVYFTKEELGEDTEKVELTNIWGKTLPNDVANAYEVDMVERGNFSKDLTVAWMRENDVVSVMPFRLYIGISYPSMDAFQLDAVDKDRTAISGDSWSTYNYYTALDDYKSSYSAIGLQMSQADAAKGPFHLGLTFNTDPYYNYSSQFSGLSVDIYEGAFRNLNALDESKKITSTIWDQTLASGGGKEVTLTDGRYEGLYTIVYSNATSQAKLLARPVLLIVAPYETYVYFSGLYDTDGSTSYDNYGNGFATRSYQYDNNGNDTAIYTVKPPRLATEHYVMKATVYAENDNLAADAAQTAGYKIYAGTKYYTTLTEAASATDVTADILGSGYGTDYSQGVYFTAFDKDGNVISWESVKTVQGEAQEEEPPIYDPSGDTYFRVTGALKGPEGAAYDAWVMPGGLDGYYYGYSSSDLNYGFQTVMLLKNSNTEALNPAETIYPTFWLGYGATAYAGHETKTDGDKVESGKNAVTLESGMKTVAYSAGAEDKAALKNYWVTFVTQQSGGPKLYINGISELQGETPKDREVFVDEEHEYRHDIFFANIGDAKMTNIKVELDAKAQEMLQIDPYWTIGTTKDLAAFTTTSSSAKYGELANVGRIRLLPLKNDDGTYKTGDIGGKLTISAKDASGTADIDPIEIPLTGKIATPTILTESVTDGVKFVPYNSLIRTDVKGRSRETKFELESGNLPNGVELYENGVLYGMPKEAGEFTFTVKATFVKSQVTATQELTLTIKDNENANVLAAADEGYKLLKANSEEVVTDADAFTGSGVAYTKRAGSFSTEVFHTQGDVDVAYALYLDGEKLELDKDYTREEGSIKYTLFQSTFATKGSAVGRHTISAECREVRNDLTTVKRTAQNYTVTSGDSGGHSSSSRRTTTTPATTTPATTTPATTTPATTTPGTNNTKPTELSYTVSGKQATLSALTDAKVNEMSGVAAPAAVLDLSGMEGVTSVNIPAAAAEKLSEALSGGEAERGTLTIKTESAELVLDEQVMKTIAEAGNGSDVALSAETVGKGDLNAAQQAALGDQTVYAGLRLSMTAGDKAITSFGGGRLTVGIPFTVPSGSSGRDFSVFYASEGGKLSRHATSFKNGELSFRIAHFSNFVVLNDPAVNLADISDNAWYTSAVDYVTRSRIMVGDGNLFSPDAGLTRAMFAQILFNMEDGANADSMEHFADVSADAWYAKAVNWAVETGVVKGVGDGRFAPDTAITREQLALMLYNYALYKGYDATRSVSLSRFTDGGRVAPWAEQAMSWAAGEKLFSGAANGDGYVLTPGSGATRAQTAKVLTYFCESYEAE